MSQAYTGTVKFFNEDKGFGFIVPDHPNQKDVFVHVTQVKKSGLNSLKEGDRVEYTLEENRGKVAAADLRKVS